MEDLCLLEEFTVLGTIGEWYRLGGDETEDEDEEEEDEDMYRDVTSRDFTLRDSGGGGATLPEGNSGGLVGVGARLVVVVSAAFRLSGVLLLISTLIIETLEMEQN